MSPTGAPRASASADGGDRAGASAVSTARDAQASAGKAHFLAGDATSGALAAPAPPKGSQGGRKRLSRVGGPFSRRPFLRCVPVLALLPFERGGFFGIALTMPLYLTTHMGMSNSGASGRVSLWNGTSYAATVLGALVADSFAGRYWALVGAYSVYAIGMLGFPLSAGVPSLKTADGQLVTGRKKSFFWAFAFLASIGGGAVQPNLTSFGSDQLNENDPDERALIPRYLNAYFIAVCVGCVAASWGLVVAQSEVSYFLCYLLACIFVWCSFAILLVFTPVYHRAKPSGTPLLRWGRTLCAAAAHWRRAVPEDRSQLHEVPGFWSAIPRQQKLRSTPGLGFLDKAAVAAPGERDADAGDAVDQGRASKRGRRGWLVTVTEVEELKCVFRLFPVFAALCVYNSSFGIVGSVFILQGAALDRNSAGWQTPPAFVFAFNSIALIITAFAYDRWLNPWVARRRGGKPITSLWRIGIGFAISVPSMLIAGGVEHVRLRVARDHGLTHVDPSVATVPMSLWWLVPQYFLMGVAEGFANVGALDIFHAEAPECIRSLALAMPPLCEGVGAYLVTMYLRIVREATGTNGRPGWVAANLNEGHLDYFYWMAAVIMAVNLVVYLFPICYCFRYREAPFDEDEAIAAIHADAVEGSEASGDGRAKGAPRGGGPGSESGEEDDGKGLGGSRGSNGLPSKGSGESW